MLRVLHRDNFHPLYNQRIKKLIKIYLLTLHPIPFKYQLLHQKVHLQRVSFTTRYLKKQTQNLYSFIIIKA